jgi:hypothetical protein
MHQMMELTIISSRIVPIVTMSIFLYEKATFLALHARVSTTDNKVKTL